MKTAVQHCAERKASIVGLGGLWERNGSFVEAFLSWDGASTGLVAEFISVKAPLMQRWFLFYLLKEHAKTPSTSLVATTNFSKGHHVPPPPKRLMNLTPFSVLMDQLSIPLLSCFSLESD